MSATPTMVAVLRSALTLPAPLHVAVTVATLWIATEELVLVNQY